MIKRHALSSIFIALLLATSLTVGGVFAVWRYYDSAEEAHYEMIPTIKGFSYSIEDIPSGEVTLIERLQAVLNRQYQTDIVTDSRDYLINETIQVRWAPDAPPYVGSMDADYATQINTLFGDIMKENPVSFILKNQDLNWDGYSEIAMYSTSDKLDSDSEWPTSAVCVYLTVLIIPNVIFIQQDLCTHPSLHLLHQSLQSSETVTENVLSIPVPKNL